MNTKILIIDDSQDVRNMMSLMFTLEGYNVVEACNGKQAMFKLKNESLPKLIFLDYFMDEMDGPQFLNELEIECPEILHKIPIVMLTGNAAVITESRAVEIISKPIGIEPLLALAKRYMH